MSSFKITTLLIFLFVAITLINAKTPETMKLPKPDTSNGIPLMKALNHRQSNRSFSNKKLSKQTLSNLLWAAFGINRPESGKRTAPSAMNKQEISIYVALKKGLYLYEAKGHKLRLVKDKDLRKFTGTQGFVSGAPVNLVYVANTNKQSNKTYYGAATGFIGQNVYLYCASKGLNVVIRGSINKSKLHEKIGLEDYKKIVLSQTIGYPKQ